MQTSSFPNKKKRINHEHHEQVKVVRWLERQKEYGNIYRFTANVRETYTGSFFQNNYNAAAGVRPGLPDLLVLAPGKLIFVELKRPRNVLLNGTLGASPSSTKPEQLHWLQDLNRYECCVAAQICYGAEEAINFISSHLKSVQAPTQTDAERRQSVVEFKRFIDGKP